jgi:DNA-binding NarL/FixJ family response regulator
MPHVLSVSAIRLLAVTRAAALRPYCTHTLASDPETALMLLRHSRIDLVILGHSMTEAQASSVVEAADSHSPSTKIVIAIVALRPVWANHVRHDGFADSSNGHAELIRIVQSILLQPAA